MNYYLKLIFLLSCLFSIFLSGCNQENDIKPSGKVVKVGAIAPFSGKTDNWGENGLLGIKTALKLEPVLANGDEIELVIEDNKHTQEATKEAFIKLAEVDKVTAVLLFARSDETLFVKSLADKYELPLFSVLSTHPQVTEESKYVTQLLFDDSVQATVSALFVLDELFVDEVAVFQDPADFHSAFLANTFIKKYSEMGGNTKNFHIDSDVKSYVEIFKGLKEDGANFIYLPLDALTVIEFIKATRAINWNPQVMLSDNVFASVMLYHKEDIGLFEGLYAPDVYSRIMPQTEYGRKIRKIYKDNFEGITTSISGLGCEGTSILLSAMNRCDDPSDSKCVNLMLRNTDNFTGLFGKIHIHGDGKAERPIFINRIEGGIEKYVVKVY